MTGYENGLRGSAGRLLAEWGPRLHVSARRLPSWWIYPLLTRVRGGINWKVDGSIKRQAVPPCALYVWMNGCGE